MEDIRSRKLTRGDGAVLLQGAGMLLKTVKEAREQTSFDEIRGEMEELRAMFEAHQRTRGGSSTGGSSWTG